MKTKIEVREVLVLLLLPFVTSCVSRSEKAPSHEVAVPKASHLRRRPCIEGIVSATSIMGSAGQMLGSLPPCE